MMLKINLSHREDKELDILNTGIKKYSLGNSYRLMRHSFIGLKEFFLQIIHKCKCLFYKDVHLGVYIIKKMIHRFNQARIRGATLPERIVVLGDELKDQLFKFSKLKLEVESNSADRPWTVNSNESFLEWYENNSISEVIFLSISETQPKKSCFSVVRTMPKKFRNLFLRMMKDHEIRLALSDTAVETRGIL